MDENDFWALIDRSREADAEQEETLEELLTGRSREDLAAFDRIYREQLVRAYRWDLWGAGYVINGGMSDDSFDYFCDWLISRGRDVFERALADPESLADVAEGDDGHHRPGPRGRADGRGVGRGRGLRPLPAAGREVRMSAGYS